MSEDAKRAEKPPSVDRLLELWRRVNDHKVAQWTVAYVALAYGAQHAVTLITEAFEWPHAVERVSMLLLALGLPVVITLAWYHGARASRRISGPELTIISILLAIGSLLFLMLVRPSEQVAAGPAVQQAGVAAARSAAASVGNAISIAVLPFANVTGDASQDFFSDGMTDEISGALSKIPDLRVVARTSAFQFKGQNRDIQSIAQQLHATHVVEGSVRKAGNRVRITVELVKSDDGISIWNDSYDRELTDVFAIQEDIARAIAGALRMPLGLKPGEQLVSSRTNDIDTYTQYLRTKGSLRARAAAEVDEVRALVTRDPNFAPAQVLLAELYNAGSAAAGRRPESDEAVRARLTSFLENAETAARRAIKLDPSFPAAYAAFGAIQARRGHWQEAEELFRKALSLDPDNPETLHSFGTTLAAAGRVREALALRVQLRAVEPFSPIYNIITADIMRVAGQNAAGIAILEAIPAETASYNRNEVLATNYAATGEYAKASDTLLNIDRQIPRQVVEDAARILRMAPTKVQDPSKLPAFNNELNFVYAHVGAMDRIMEYPERAAAVGSSSAAVRQLWDPLYAPIRKTERFKTFVRKTGLVEYWRAKGWPDLCHPTTGDDFECS